jgi:hypothetical protein
MKTNLMRISLALVAAALLAACSQTTPVEQPDVPCTGEGCPCIFAVDCPDGMNCINGYCSAENPFGDIGFPDLGLGDAIGEGRSTGDAVPDGGGDDILHTIEFGDGCTGNLQCRSGWCVDSPDGGYCTRTCEEGCPDGWLCKIIAQTYPDTISICVQDKTRLCLSCEMDSHCGDAGDLCLDIGGGKFCGRDCGAEPCPSGYVCTELETPDGPSKQCLPSTGACDCGATTEGLVRGCFVTNDSGTCFGFEHCDPLLGWVECSASVPEPESCDGLDNNCDGQPDEGFAPEPCTQENEIGTCQGTRSCQGAAGWVCSAVIPSPEACNGLDDDCNGAVDEGFVDDLGHYLDVENCGMCGNSCLAKYVGAAEVGCVLDGDDEKCAVQSCLPGYFMFNETTCLAEDSFLCQVCSSDADCYGDLSKCLPVSLTDPRTFCFRDCSGLSEFSTVCPGGYSCTEMPEGTLCIPDNGSCDCSDGNAGQTKACSLANDVGVCFGTETCVPETGWTGCSATTPGVEACDGLDNDCNGMLDEGTASGAPCATVNEHGSCPGIEVCGGKEGLLCSAATPAPEACDGLDNDCDGSTDEGFAVTVGEPPVLKYGLLVGHCGACGYQCPEVAHGAVACDPLPAVPACVVDSCEPGYYNYMGVACLAIPEANLCAPCLSDGDCQGPGDVCLEEAGGLSYCGRDCAAGSIYSAGGSPCTGEIGQQGCCPSGFLCQPVGDAMQCRPITGSCTCVENGKVKACSVKNGFGECIGTTTCATTGGDLGWSACAAPTPAAEVCDGKDNDCDGAIDGQDFSLDFTTTPTASEACSNGPACLGQWACLGAEWHCGAPPATEEKCDGADNDCDGSIDEEFFVAGFYQVPEHCGACGYDCLQLIPHSVAPQCSMATGKPQCLATQCEAGYFPFGGGKACMLLPDNLCQPCGTDADCLVPSSRCVSLGQEKVCGRDCSITSPFGASCPQGYSCKPVGGSSQCVPESGTCVCGPETVGLSRSCTVGKCTGQQICQQNGGLYQFTDCSAEGVIPEVCDGADNDCDGKADEGFVDGKGAYVADDNCGVCGNNCLTQFNVFLHHATGECNPGTNPPSCRVKACVDEVEGGKVYEWVDVNGIADDGCECRRLQGNLTDDEPDATFLKEGEQVPSFPQALADYIDANCDGIDGVVTQALFVSSANPLPGNGTLASPYKTIGQAVNAFAASGAKYILVAGGVYQENVKLKAGIRMHGGYSQDFRNRDIVLFPSEILGLPPAFAGGVVGSLNAEGITGTATLVSGFTIVGYDVVTIPAAGPGEPSYGAYLSDSDSKLEIRNCLMVGGAGGSGANGSNGANGFGSLTPGGTVLNGSNGSNAGSCVAGVCSNKSTPGGAGGTNPQCASANGPAGGGVVCPEYNQPSYTPALPGHDGAPGYSWTLDSQSSAGCYGHATEAGYPTAIKKLDGGNGKSGSDGSGALQGTGCSQASGAFVGGLWSGFAGAAGQGGGNGQAGGSGGSSGGIDTAPAAEMPPGVGAYGSPSYKLGATGGGAGAGGCGGVGGSGGQAGGASIAVLVRFSSKQAVGSAPVIQANVIERGYGGAGGDGGYGGTGGKGGSGGTGGNAAGYWIDFKAGKGGRGGQGGEGGGGGGACGGASFGIAAANYAATWNLPYAAGNQFPQAEAVKTGGAGGKAGVSGTGNPAGDGQGGATQNVALVPAP